MIPLFNLMKFDITRLSTTETLDDTILLEQNNDIALDHSSLQTNPVKSRKTTMKSLFDLMKSNKINLTTTETLDFYPYDKDSQSTLSCSSENSTFNATTESSDSSFYDRDSQSTLSYSSENTSVNDCIIQQKNNENLLDNSSLQKEPFKRWIPNRRMIEKEDVKRSSRGRRITIKRPFEQHEEYDSTPKKKITNSAKNALPKTQRVKKINNPLANVSFEKLMDLANAAVYAKKIDLTDQPTVKKTKKRKAGSDVTAINYLSQLAQTKGLNNKRVKLFELSKE